MEGLKESERHKQEISILENDPQKYIEWLIKNLNRLMDINKVRKETLELLAGNLNTILSFHKTEKNYLEQIRHGTQIEQNKLKLASLYIESENYHLANSLLSDLQKSMSQCGDVYFYLGCCAAQSNMLEKANHYFQTAIEYNPEFHPEIQSYIQKIGDTFLEFARYFKTQPGRELSVKYMVQKGLKYHPENAGLQKEMEIIIRNELEKIKSEFAADNYQNSAELINEWYQHAMDKKTFFESFSSELISHIFLYKGKLLIFQKKYQNALSILKSAMEYAPDDYDIHSAIIDTLFITGDFNEAIAALNNAVKLDKKFAAYWETIGDSLQCSGQPEDAIIAYENCFINLPSNINILRKMGDCYTAAGQLEAARAAYEQFKIKENKS